MTSPTEVIDGDVVAALELDSPDAVRVASGRVSTVWRAVRAGAAVALRRSPWFRTIDEVDYEHELLRRLRVNSAPVARFVAGPMLVGGAVWSAFEWIEGDQPPRPASDLGFYGSLLARLHDAASGPAVEMGQRSRWGRMDEFLRLPRAGGVAFADIADDFVTETGGRGGWLRALAAEVDDRLRAAALDTHPMVVVHGDFGPHQLLVRDSDVGAVVDWDFCHLDTRLADIAIATAHARPTIGRATDFLRAYLETSSLDPGDLGLLDDLRRAFHLNNLATQVCALAAADRDLSGPIDMITTRLEREQWWGPLLAAAAADVRGRPRSWTARPRPPLGATSSDLDVGHELADRAAAVAMHYFEAGVTTETKADATPVTDADRAIERMLRDALAELRPADAVLGEEYGITGSGPRTWILDPIDGTASFAIRDPNWRVQIALMEDDRIVLAVVDEPANERRWWATAGGGAFEQRTADDEPRRLIVSTNDDATDAVIASHPARVAPRLPPHRPMTPRSPLPLVEVVRGEIDAFYVECCQIWDHAPWVLLVLEAGGAFTDHDGGVDPGKRGGLYSNGRVHDALLAAIRRDPQDYGARS